MTRKLVDVFLADVTAIRLTIGVCALLFSFGLFFANPFNGAYDRMLEQAPAWAWGVAFFVYGCSKFMIVTEWPRPINRLGALVVVVAGSYLWLFTIMSFADNVCAPTHTSAITR